MYSQCIHTVFTMHLQWDKNAANMHLQCIHDPLVKRGQCIHNPTTSISHEQNDVVIQLLCALLEVLRFQ